MHIEAEFEAMLAAEFESNKSLSPWEGGLDLFKKKGGEKINIQMGRV